MFILVLIQIVNQAMIRGLPVPGTGKWDWKGLLPFEMNPKVYNPLSGYIANWNNSPQKDYPASDLFAFLWGGPY